MLSSIETFVTLYETRNFTKTAKILFLTQPAVSARLRRLEEDLNSILFKRLSSKEVIPTKAGTAFYPKAIKLLQDWEDAQTQFNSDCQNKISFNIGLSPSSAALFEIGLFKTLEKNLKCIDLNIQIHDSKTIFKLIKNHELHLGIIERIFNHESVSQFELLEDQLVLAGRQDSDNFFVREVNLEPIPFMKKFLKEEVFTQKNKIYINNIDTIMNYINNGYGTSIISKNTLAIDTPYIELKRDYHIVFSGIYYKDEQNKIILELIKIIRNQLVKNSVS